VLEIGDGLVWFADGLVWFADGLVWFADGLPFGVDGGGGEGAFTKACNELEIALDV